MSLKPWKEIATNAYLQISTMNASPVLVTK